MRAAVYLTALFLAGTPVVNAGTFAEGYSSVEPGGPSSIYFRAFTIITGRQECEKSQRPVELRVFPNPLRMNVGDRIYRSNIEEHPGELVVEAYDEGGNFLPAVPIIVTTIDVQKVTGSQSDWDYFEAIGEGEAELVVFWLCAAPNGAHVEARVRVLVTSSNAEVGER